MRYAFFRLRGPDFFGGFLLNSIGKILEKIISQRLWWFLTNNKLIHPNQFGFKKGKSTSDSPLFVDHLLTKSLNTKKHISLVSFDFAGAIANINTNNTHTSFYSNNNK